METAAPGEQIQLILASSRNSKSYILCLEAGKRLDTHQGVLLHNDLINKPYGSTVLSHLGVEFFLLRPSTADLTRMLKRRSQIIFPKDLGLILLKLSVEPGQQVIEAGTGSGALTLALARAVGPTGQVISYDVRHDMQSLALSNLEMSGLSDRVILKTIDVSHGFDETEAPALFLDVPRPWDLLSQVHDALLGGGFFGALVPTANQVVNLLEGLEREPFAAIEVVEVFLRRYKNLAARLRPDDRMVAHTGYLIFARSVLASKE
jgi:tRNA (adenine57-N1/adenine58-N1)-methyltransferase